jgi:hypothetical protein
VFASGFLIMCSAFAIAFGLTAVFGHFHGGLDVGIPATVIPGALAIILASVIISTLRRVARLNSTHAQHVDALIARIVPLSRPPPELGVIE